MDFVLVIRRRLEELGFEQRDLATAAEVTESYISQLLTRKKMPPATDRTGLYGRMEQFLRLPGGELFKSQLPLRDMSKRIPLQWQHRACVLLDHTFCGGRSHAHSSLRAG